MAGIYIHIPFCRKACHYCNFHFSTTGHQKNALVNALLKEIQLTGQWTEETIETIYFGGGTPSLLSEQELLNILASLRNTYSLDKNLECTLEANPDDISEAALAGWLELGINRLSVGIQSFRNEDLEWMNRAHDAGQALQALTLIPRAGFLNYSADLIYGIPGLDHDSWKNNIHIMTDAGLPHISAYALTVEPRTALDGMIRQHKKADVDPEMQSTQFLILMDELARAGYEHYEISNFAKPGMRSRHNSAYWQGKPYRGFGPSAHSFDGKSRSWNIANNALYIRAIENGTIPQETETLSPSQQFNEYVMISLRTSEGISLQRIRKIWGDERREALLLAASPHLQRQHLEVHGNGLVLTREGRLFADGIAADLFWI